VSNQLSIRKATQQDSQQISELILENIESNPNNYTEAQKQAWKKYNTSKRITEQLNEKDIYCAFLKDKLVGTIAIKNNELSGFYTSYYSRNNGIGTSLLTYIQQIAIKNNIKKIYLVATPSALNFYQKRGFTLLNEITTTFYGIDYQEFEMQKKLN
jgi:N-acetylglutamate synthase-like GNAT family acetyltransferase